MRTSPSAPSLSLLVSLLVCSTACLADQQAKMSVTVIASGSDSTRSDGEWSKAGFSYRASFTTVLETDGEPSDTNMYDPDYLQNAMASAEANMAKIQAALDGNFSDDEEEETEPEYRYLFYLGQMECPSTLSLEINEKLEGEYADVGGMQPYTITYTADSQGTSLERNLLCVANNSVLDIRNNVLYRSTIGFPEVTGHYISHETNRGNLQDNSQSLHSALPQLVSDHVFSTLRVAPASGHNKTTLTATSPVVTRTGTYGGYEGSIDVEIIWSFEVLP